MNSSSAAASPTRIWDLNEDCLLEVYKHMELRDLCHIADACRWFRETSQAHFASLKVKMIYLGDVCLDEGSLVRRVLNISSLLRNFGGYMESIKVWSVDAYSGKLGYDQRIVQLICRYCYGTLIELILLRYSMTVDIAVAMRPLLLHLQKLATYFCNWDNIVLNSLSIWSPELRELMFHQIFCNLFPSRFDGLRHQSFQKLISITLEFSSENITTNDDIDDFLKHNPQLKSLKLKHVPILDDRIFASIAEHVPRIESIEIAAMVQKNDSNIKYIGKLTSLKSLQITKVDIRRHGNFLRIILDEIHTNDIPLKHFSLQISGKSQSDARVWIVSEIAKLKMLERLHLSYVGYLNASHIIDMCKQLNELTEISLYCRNAVSCQDELIEIIKSAKNLQKLIYMQRQLPHREEILIDVDFHEKSHLSIILKSMSYRKNIFCAATIPKGWSNNYKYLMSLVVEFDDFWVYED